MTSVQAGAELTGNSEGLDRRTVCRSIVYLQPSQMLPGQRYRASIVGRSRRCGSVREQTQKPAHGTGIANTEDCSHVSATMHSRTYHESAPHRRTVFISYVWNLCRAVVSIWRQWQRRYTQLLTSRRRLDWSDRQQCLHAAHQVRTDWPQRRNATGHLQDANARFASVSAVW